MDTLLKIIQDRRSVRDFEDIQIEESKLNLLVDAARWAPSSCNRQSTKFMFISDDEGKKKLESISTGGKGFASSAPVIAILLSDLSIYNLPYERNLAYVDAALASQNFMLQASSMGLGTCYLNWALPNPEDDIELYRAFNIPEKMIIVGLIPVGIPNKGKEIPVSERKPIEEYILK